MAERFTYGSVCSGIEAASVAWHPLGWRASFVSEIEAFPRAVLQHRWPEVPLHGDFTTIEAGRYEPIDLLVGGTPCQSFSVAGLRGGLADGRGNLALEYLRLADRLRPRWLVWENVPGVLSSAGGRDFGAILGGMVELGYGFAYRVLDAQFFGVAQRRRRVFVVGHAGDWRRAAAVLFERHGLQGHPAPRRQAGEGTAGTVTAGARKCDHAGSASSGLIAQAYGGNDTRGPIDVATACNAHGGPMGRLDFESETFVAHTLKGEGFDASEDGTGRGTPIVPIAFMSNMSASHMTFARDHTPTLRIGGDGGNAMAVAFDLAQITSGANRTRVSPGLPASTLNAAGQMHVAGTVRSHTRPGSNEVGTIVHTSAVRRLTPRECERLQGFPDDYTLIPWRKGLAPDGPRYKALGNSMAVPVMTWIGQRIAQVDAIQMISDAA